MGITRSLEKKEMLSFLGNKKINENSSLKANEKMTLVPKKRVFPCSPVFYKGSMTFEACLVVPMFLFFMMTLLLGIEMVRLQSNVWAALCMSESRHFINERNEQMHLPRVVDGEELSSEASTYILMQENSLLCAKGNVEIISEPDVKGVGKIQLQAGYEIKPFIYWLPISNTSYGTMRFQERILAHGFCGYRGPLDGEWQQQQQKYVFLTKTGKRYHVSRECSSLRIHPSAVNFVELSEKRNQQGGKYYPCERCHPSGSGVLYITGDGNRYHRDARCSSLKRTVYAVSLEEALGRGKTPCIQCGG